jgi:hypothetical protein
MARNPRNDGKGTSLAKGPVAIVAIILIAFAVIALASGATQFKAKPIEGPVMGKTVLGLELNGWSMLLTGAAGLLLLFGSPMHRAAKSLSLIVGLVLGAASVISLYDKQHDVFGIFAANGRTSLGWGVAAAVLLVLALLPRIGKGRRDDDAYDGRAVADDRAGRDRAVAAESPGGRRLRDRT